MTPASVSGRLPRARALCARASSLSGVVAALLCLTAGLLHAAPASGPRETWLGMYMGSARVGYTVVREQPSTYRDKPAVKTDSTSHTELTVLGARLTQDITTVTYSTTSGQPVHEQYRMSSGGKTTEVQAEFAADHIDCTLTTAAGKSRKTIPIPHGAQLIGDSLGALDDGNLKPGAKFQRKAFDPLTLSLDDLTVAVEREETIQHQGKPVKCLVITTRSPLATLTTFQSQEDGGPIRIETAMGITLVRETRQQAQGASAAGYQPPQDFAVSTSVQPDRALPATGIQELKICLSGLPDESYVFSDQRQSVTAREGSGPISASYSIRTVRPDEASAAKLPVTDEQQKRWVSPEDYIDCASPKIIQAAQQATGGETSLVKAAGRIRAWVNTAMKPESRAGILRPASDILADPKGVCRDYAVLYAALARADGIPARVVGGLVFARGGFYYHAWNEVWTGSAWMPVDSTLGTDAVDATHIKLTEGSATDMFRMGKVIGQLKAEVLSFR